MSPRRAVHLSNVPVRLDGQLRAKVTIEQGASGEGLVTVRPHRGRAYALPLSVVAEMVAWRAAKAEAAAAPPKARRSGRLPVLYISSAERADMVGRR